MASQRGRQGALERNCIRPCDEINEGGQAHCSSLASDSIASTLFVVMLCEREAAFADASKWREMDYLQSDQ